MYRAALVVLSLLPAACATTHAPVTGPALIQVPIAGQLSDGTPMAGEAVADRDGKGTFFVQSPRGARCSGTFDSLLTQPTITTAVSCADGRTGEAVITHQASALSGTIVAKLSDGTKGRFVFGNLAFDQAFSRDKQDRKHTGKRAVFPKVHMRDEYARKLKSDPVVVSAMNAQAVCARKNLSSVDDSTADATAVALALYLRCRTEYDATTEALVVALDNSYIRDLRQTRGTQIEEFLPAVIQWRHRVATGRRVDKR